MTVLIACIILNAFIGIIFKYFEKYNINTLQAIVTNYFVCILMASVVQHGNPIPSDLFEKEWIMFAIGLGLLLIIVFNIVANTVQQSGVMVTTIFQKMSLIAPALIAILYYNEPCNELKWLGIVASLSSIILLSYQRKSKDDQFEKSSPLLWILPLGTFIGSCVVDSGFFFIENLGLVKNGDLGFVASLFMFATFFGLIWLGYQLITKRSTLAFKNIFAGICLGIPNFFSIYLLLLALQSGMDASVVFPVNNVGVLTLSAIFAVLIFKETLTLNKIIGFILAFTAIICITLS